MEVPAPESGEATATGKRGAGVGRAPESPGWGAGAGTPRCGDAERGSSPAGGSRAGGRGGGGVRRALGGRGRARPLSPGLARFRFSRRGRAVCRQWRVSSPAPRAPRSDEPEDLPPRGGCRLRSRPPTGLGACPRRKGRWLARGAEPGRAAWPWRSARLAERGPGRVTFSGEPTAAHRAPSGCQAPGRPAVQGRNGPYLLRLDSRGGRQ